MIKKMSDEEYFSHPALNHSGFKIYDDSPALYQHRLKNPLRPMQDMVLGLMIHCLYLEKAEFDIRYTEVKGVAGYNTKAVRDALKGLGPRDQVYTVPMKETADEVVAVLDNCHALPDPDHIEIAAFTTHEGVPMKGKADWISNDNWLWDLKTTSDLDKWSKPWEVRDKMYYLQAAWYMRVFEEMMPLGFRWLVISTKHPFNFRIFDATPELLASADEYLVTGINQYKVSVDTDDWSQNIRPLRS